VIGDRSLSEHISLSPLLDKHVVKQHPTSTMTVTTMFPNQGGKNQGNRRALRVSAIDVKPVFALANSGIADF
jgi:hypothetical protein